METKKNPAKDIHRKSFLFFQIGLGISITLVITAFEWRTEVRKLKPRASHESDHLLVLIPSTVHTNPEPPKPQQEKEDPTKPKEIITISTETNESGGEIPTAGVIDQSQLTESNGTTFTPPVEEPETCTDCLVSFPERAAEPIGGYEAFYNIIRNSLKYPKQAQRMQVQGRVFVEFVVNRDGIPSNLKIIRGIGVGCDEEAMRVIALTRWNPAKQRGKPVRMKMVIPIQFQLN